MSENDTHSVPLHGFTSGGRPAFVSRHAPAGESSDALFLICPPLGYESIQTYAALRSLADVLARRGFESARVQYDGTGESPGSDLDPGRFEAWVGSVLAAARELLTGRPDTKLGLVGVRAGALVAAAAAEELNVDWMVLWEPTPSGAAYVREMQIVASATHGALSGSEDVDSPYEIESGGYGFMPETVAELSSRSISADAFTTAPETFVVARSDRPVPKALVKKLREAGLEVEVEHLEGFKEMMRPPAKSEVPTVMVDRIADWVAGREVSSAPARPVPSLADSAVHEGARRTPIRFGPERRLFGMVVDPDVSTEDGPRPEHGVLFLTGGVVPRTAVNGMYVPLSDCLAAAGVRCLRVDLSGICESYPPPGRPWNVTYMPNMAADVLAAIEALGTPRVWLVGLCSGAYAAYLGAFRDERVEGVTFINPIVLGAAEGLSDDDPSFRQFVTTGQGAPAASQGRLKRLLSGGVDVRAAARVRMARAVAAGGSVLEDARRLVRLPPTGVAGEMSRLLARGTAVDFVFSRGDRGHAAVVSLLGKRVVELKRAGLDLHVIDGADHTFSPFGPRAELLDRLAGRIQGWARSGPSS